MTSEVYSITTAPAALADDQARRTRRYLVQMGLRLVFFVAAILTSGWLRWSMAICAVVIPYVAVLAANAGRDMSTRAALYTDEATLPELTAMPPADASGDDHPRVVDHEDSPAPGDNGRDD